MAISNALLHGTNLLIVIMYFIIIDLSHEFKYFLMHKMLYLKHAMFLYIHTLTILSITLG